MAAKALIIQKVQILKAFCGAPKSSDSTYRIEIGSRPGQD
jgi:hypothetical protein